MWQLIIQGVLLHNGGKLFSFMSLLVPDLLRNFSVAQGFNYY